MIRKLRAYFAPRGEVSAAYLYGSRASGEQRPWSDADVAVLLRNGCGKAFDWRLRHASGLGKLLESEVDLSILNEADPLLRIQVLSRGLLLFARDSRALDAFVQRSLREYWDYVPVLRALEEGTLRRLGSY